jgi:hypothetical protein
MKTREELKKLINESHLFLIDRVNDAEYFVAEKRKFIGYLFEITKLVWTKHVTKIDTDDKEGSLVIGLEVYEVANTCINNYDSKNGDFLKYFNFSLKRAIIKGEIKEAKIQKNTLSGNAPIIGKDGDEKIEQFDLIAATDDSLEDEVIAANMVYYIVKLVNSVFSMVQDRSKELLSKLLTIRMLKNMLIIMTKAEIINEAKFIDTAILTDYLISGELPTSRQIATLCNTTEQQASRAIKIFLGKLMGNDKFCEAYAYMSIEDD